MLKRSLLIAALALTGCGETASHDYAHEDDFLTKLQADYPVTLAKVSEKEITKAKLEKEIEALEEA